MLNGSVTYHHGDEASVSKAPPPHPHPQLERPFVIQENLQHHLQMDVSGCIRTVLAHPLAYELEESHSLNHQFVFNCAKIVRPLSLVILHQAPRIIGAHVQTPFITLHSDSTSLKVEGYVTLID